MEPTPNGTEPETEPADDEPTGRAGHDLPTPAEILGSSARGRAAMQLRDVGAVYRVLQEAGWSQRRIAEMTGQGQSEVSEILAGREVTSVALLERVADGLGTPRGWWRLAGYDSAEEIQAAHAFLAQHARLARGLDRQRREALAVVLSARRALDKLSETLLKADDILRQRPGAQTKKAPPSQSRPGGVSTVRRSI